MDPHLFARSPLILQTSVHWPTGPPNSELADLGSLLSIVSHPTAIVYPDMLNKITTLLIGIRISNSSSQLHYHGTRDRLRPTRAPLSDFYHACIHTHTYMRTCSFSPFLAFFLLRCTYFHSFVILRPSIPTNPAALSISFRRENL